MLVLIWSTLLIAQIVLVFIFGMINQARINILVYVGYLVWVISMFFGWWPIIALKRKGGVEKGKSYVHTTSLVTTGLYSIVRHPQYTAGILFSLALVLVSQHVLIIVLGLIAMVLMYIDIMNADRHEIKKFGDAYREYMKKVPRINFLLGIILRLFRSR